MLSGIGADVQRRPRPPGQRKSYTVAQSNLTDAVAALPQTSSPLPLLSGRAATTDAHSKTSLMAAAPPLPMLSGLDPSQQPVEIDEDLGLDLPTNLIAAIHRSANAARLLALVQQDDTVEATHPAALWQRARSHVPAVANSVITAHPINEADLDFSFSRTHGDNAESSELDKEWIAALAREELVSLLCHANTVIRDRERDLGIAAAIGQALLQKNNTLRSKHQQVMTRLALDVTDDEDDDENTNMAMGSPPNNDFDAKPLAVRPGVRADYFGLSSGPSSPAKIKHQQTPPPTRPPLSQIFEPEPFDCFGESGHHLPSLISSVPSTPGGMSVSGDSLYALSSKSGQPTHSRKGSKRLRDRQSSSLHAFETQKQLISLSAQNEALLIQLAELQEEAKGAKREGVRRLRKLNKEIENLQLELEAATQRNAELEHEKQRENAIAAARLSSYLKGREHHRMSVSPSPAKGKSTRSSVANANSLARSLDALLKDPHEKSSEQQRALVLRLLEKMRELKATNEVLEGKKREREGRLGAALERGVRLSDAYDAVLQAYESEFSATLSYAELSSSSAPSQRKGKAKSAPSSPLHSKRATGNRVQVERRTTIRKALRSQPSVVSGSNAASGFLASSTSSRTSSCLNSSSSSASNNSASLLSPREETGRRRPWRVQSVPAFDRARIRMTPSMEDIAAKRKEEQDEWENIANESRPSSTPLRNRDRANSLNLSDAEKMAVCHRLMSRKQDVAQRPRWNSEIGRDALTGSEARRSSNASMDSSLTDIPASSPDVHKQHGIASPSSDHERCLHQFLETSPKYEPKFDLAEYSGSPYAPQRRRRQGHSWDSTTGLGHSRALAPPFRCLPKPLGSELGNVFKGVFEEEPEHSEYLKLRDTLRVESSSDSVGQLRPTADSGSLRAPEEATSGIAHLNWSTSTVEPAVATLGILREGESDHLAIGFGGQDKELTSAKPPSLHNFSLVEGREDDGNWLPVNSDRAEDALIQPGGLRDRMEPSEQHYTSLCDALTRRPVQWADDDDYGVPIKESEARRLKLTPAKSAHDCTKVVKPAAQFSTGKGTALRLLTWVTGGQLTVPSFDEKAVGPRAHAIQSKEQLQEEEKAQALLRAKCRLARGRRFVDFDTLLGRLDHQFKGKEQEPEIATDLS